MEYKNSQVRAAARVLLKSFKELKDKKQILRSPHFTALFDHLKTLPAGNARADFGKEVNALKAELEQMVADHAGQKIKIKPLDVTAPFDTNVPPEDRPSLLPVENASRHPLSSELELILEIFARMGFSAVESRELDDDYHMFTSVNFPHGHPARDDYDTFVTDEGLIAPAHTSTMQNRVLKAGKKGLQEGRAISVVIPGRVFRNEDLDARHEHTFHQLEGVYVDEGIHAGHLVAAIKTWLSSYYQKDVEIKIQPFYFPFTEPSFEFAASCPFCDSADLDLDATQGSKEKRANRMERHGERASDADDTVVRQEPDGMPGSVGQQGGAIQRGGKGCHICSHTGWIELGGCGMIHTNVLTEAGIDPVKYSGFAWGFGIERLVMLKYGIEDVRHFHSGNLKFLRQFK